MWKCLYWSGVLIVVLSYPLRGQQVQESFWLPLDGPYGGLVNDLLPVPWDSTVLIAGGDWTGLSTDKGLSWNFIRIPGPRQFAPDPVTKRLWAATERGLYMTDDGAKTWTIMSGQFPIGGVNAVCLADSGAVIAGTDIPTTSDAVVYRSADSGHTWVGVYTADMGLPRCEHLYNVQRKQEEGGGQIIFAIGGNHGLVRSTDGGRRWDWIWEGIDAHLTAMAFPRYGQGACFAVSNQGALYASTDQGQNWQMLFQSTTGESFTALSLTGRDSTRLMIGTIKGSIHQGRVAPDSMGQLYWSPDTIIGSAGSGVYALWSIEGKEILAGTLRSGLCYSNDSGRTYSPRDEGWNIIGDSYVSKAANGAIAAGMGGHGVYFSSDHGLNWIRGSRGLPDFGQYQNGMVSFDALKMDPGRVLYCSMNFVYDTLGQYLGGMVYRLSPPDTVWHQVSVSTTYGPPEDFLLFNDDTIYFSFSIAPYRSFDGGSRWEPVMTGVDADHRSVFDLIGTFGQGKIVLVASMRGRIYRSTDGGDNWTRSESGISGVGIYKMCTDSAGTIFAVSDQIYASSDTGKTWVRIAQAPELVVNQIAALPDNSLMFLSYKGVYRSTDHGINWFKQSEGIAADDVYSLAIDSAGYVYVSTYSAGLYRTRMPITKTTTGTGEARPNLPAIYALHQNYPNPFNPTTDIGYRIADLGFVSLKIYNTLGQQVATLVNEVKPPGRYSVTWSAGNNPSGIYFYRLSAGSFSEVRKMLLIR